MANRLYGYIGKNWPGSKIWRELPVESRQGDQILHGVADMVVETDKGFTLIDYKAFAWERDRCVHIAPIYAPQLDAYAAALSPALGKPCAMRAIYFPIVGLILTADSL